MDTKMDENLGTGSTNKKRRPRRYTGKKLWPRDELRPADEKAGTEIMRGLWPRDELRPADEKADAVIERELWPRDELRPADQKADAVVKRTLWQGEETILEEVEEDESENLM